MKPFKLIISSCAIAFLISCNTNPTQNSAINTKKSPSDSTFSVCYSYIVKKDSVLLNALMTGDSITGSLGYKLYEKDRANGSILGKMYGDTLRAVYTFVSEGTESTREVIFLKKDTLLIEGIGNVKDTNGKVVFENAKNVKFEGMVLQAVPCK